MADPDVVRSALEAALELLDRPAIVLDGAGRARMTNELARARLAKEPGLASRMQRSDGALVLIDDAERAPAIQLALARQRWELTPRQMMVLRHVVAGASNDEIVEALGCTAKNVEQHLTALLRRSGCSTRTALIAAVWTLW